MLVALTRNHGCHAEKRDIQRSRSSRRRRAISAWLDHGNAIARHLVSGKTVSGRTACHDDESCGRQRALLARFEKGRRFGIKAGFEGERMMDERDELQA